jgi:uncharacterized protein (DUF58 family)
MSADTQSETLLSPELTAQLERMELVSRKIFRGNLRGERRSRRKGQSVELADFRNYVPGDDPRFIDWNSFARLDRLFLKIFLEEEDLHFYCLVDCSPSMQFGEPSKYFYARQLAAALGYVGLIRSDRVKIEPICAEVNQPSPVLRSRNSLWRLLAQIRGWQPGAPISLEQSVRRFVLRNTGKGVVVLISDLMDRGGYEGAFKYLIARDYHIFVIQVLAQAEIDPDVSGDVRLVDCEDQAVVDVSVSPWLLDRYKQSLARFLRGAADYFARRSITYFMTTTDRPIEQMIGGYLRQRGLLR